METFDKLAAWIAKQLDGMFSKRYYSSSKKGSFMSSDGNISRINGVYYYNNKKVDPKDPSYKTIVSTFTEAMKELDMSMKKLDEDIKRMEREMDKIFK